MLKDMSNSDLIIIGAVLVGAICLLAWYYSTVWSVHEDCMNLADKVEKTDPNAGLSMKMGCAQILHRAGRL